MPPAPGSALFWGWDLAGRRHSQSAKLLKGVGTGLDVDSGPLTPEGAPALHGQERPAWASALPLRPSPPVCGETQHRGYRTEGSGRLRAQHSTNP